MSTLNERIAAALGWPVADTYTLSLQSLRELVRPVDANLAAELARSITSGTCITRRTRR